MGKTMSSEWRCNFSRHLEEAVKRMPKLLRVRIVGTAPLVFTSSVEVCHKPKKAGSARWPYYKNKTPVLPSVYLKYAIVEAGEHYQNKKLSRTFLLGAVRIDKEGLELSGSRVRKFKQHIVRRSVFAKPLYWFGTRREKWSADVLLTYNPQIINSKQLEDLLVIAGKRIGVGSSRPDLGKNTTFGSFSVKRIPTFSTKKKKRGA